MDLNIVYPFLSVLDTDSLLQNQNNLIGLGRALDAIIGETTQFNNLACVPHSPPNLTVMVNSGEIYSLQQVSPGTYGNLPINTSLIMKQGILTIPVSLSCPAPVTAGFSISYLVQFAFQETDTNLTSRAFYNPALIPPPYAQSVNILRADTVLVNAKAGTPATTGTQVPPTPDVGYTGAYIVTVAQGQTTITGGNITISPGSPFLAEKLKDKISQAFADARYAQLQDFTYNSGVINGGMTIAQREPFDLTAQTLGIGFVDTMMGQVTGTTVTSGTLTQGTGQAFSFTGYTTKFSSITTTGTGVATLVHRIESNDAVNYRNVLSSFSSVVQHDIGSSVNFQITVSKATAKNNFTSITQLGQSGLISVPTGVGTQIALPSITMGDCTNGIEIRITAAIGAVTTKNIHFTNLFLNTGASVSSFVPKDETITRIACRRRYRKTYSDNVPVATITTSGNLTIILVGPSGGTGSASFSVNLEPPMIKTPTIALYSPDSGISGSFSAGLPAEIAVSNENNFTARNIAGGTPGLGYEFHYQAVADL